MKKLQILARDPTIELWALDEVMFKQHGSTCRTWIAPEDHDPVVFHAPSRKGVGFFGAVRVRGGRFTYAREQDRFNAGTFFCFLKFLRRITARSNKKVVVILDNARYHHAALHKEWRKGCSDRFELLFLPPYCPELNIIERVWKLTRKMCTHNRYFPDLDGIIESVEKQFDGWRQGSEVLRCSIN